MIGQVVRYGMVPSKFKMASSSHRKPATEHVLMPAGWVDIGAMCAVTGADGPAVKAALEREL